MLSFDFKDIVFVRFEI